MKHKRLAFILYSSSFLLHPFFSFPLTADPGNKNAYIEPQGGWTYIYSGNTASPGADTSSNNNSAEALWDALDGTWDHINGNDEWDGTEIAAGNPGGAMIVTEEDANFIRIQDPGDPRDHALPDPSNRKVYFAHRIADDVGDTAAVSILDDGITISFRARISTQEPLDPMYPDTDDSFGSSENPDLPPGTPWPASGNGYLGHHSGQGNFSIYQSGGVKIISFSLALGSESMSYDSSLDFNDPTVGGESGLVMNSLNSNVPNDAVDPWDNEGTLNFIPLLDPTQWHEFWITIETDKTNTGTHLVKVYSDDSAVPHEFLVTAGTAHMYNDSYMGMGFGATGQMGALDIDFVSYKSGIHVPQVDCNGNGVPDPNDIADGTSQDVNGNGIPDECEDCNGNGILDPNDIINGTSQDCNGNGIPDECDIADGTSQDCNGNNIPDECDIADGTSQDCNGNGIPDECDIAGGTSLDVNMNGVPDECEVIGNIIFRIERWNSDNTPPEIAPNLLEEGELSFVDRTTHNYRNIPLELVGMEYVKVANNDKAISNYELDVTLARPGTLYLFLDNRLGNNDINSPPDLLAAGMDWVFSLGFVDTDLDIGIDEAGDGIANKWCSVFSKEASAETITLFQQNDGGLRNMYAVAAKMYSVNTPQPGNEESKVLTPQQLSWIDPYNPISHDIYFGADPVAVENATTTAPLGVYQGRQTDTTFDPDLDYDTTYFWRIDMVVDDKPITKGPVWYFTTVDGPHDCNGNQIPDDIDIYNGTSQDINNNGIPDECELDCNGNGIPDDRDISQGTSQDVNQNGIPDECEPDCNNNQNPDSWDIAIQNLVFKSPSSYLLFGRGQSGAVGDFDGDDDLDIITATQNNISLSLNYGDGTFTDAVEITSVEGLVRCVAMGDFDGDEDLDFAMTYMFEVANDPDPPDTYGRMKIFRNLGNAAFEFLGEYNVYPGSHAISIGDLDSDDDLDIALANAFFYIGDPFSEFHIISLFLNTGNGVFSKQDLPDYGCTIDDVEIGDFDKDDDLDLAVAFSPRVEGNDFEGIVIYNNSGSADFSIAESYPLERLKAIVIADFNQDGYVDLALAKDYINDISVLLNNQDGTFAESVNYDLGAEPADIVAGDIDQDEDIDIITTVKNEGDLLIMRNFGQGIFADPVSLSTSQSDPGYVVLALLDDNNLLDLALINDPSQDLKVLLNHSISLSQDCNGNGIPDECDLADANSLDCDGNGIPDECDIAAGSSTDVNDDGIPDECQIDVRIEPVVVAIDPSLTSEERTALPESITGVVRGSTYYIEIWASDIGEYNTGLTGVYVDVVFCSQTTATALDHGTIYNSFTDGTIQSGMVQNFGGATFSGGIGIEPQWVRIGWIQMYANVDIDNCIISIALGTGGVAGFDRGLIDQEFVKLGSSSIRITPPVKSYDLDGDNIIIGLGDLSLFVPSWQQSVPPADLEDDFDCDCFVGVGDLSYFATGWQKAPDDPTIIYPPCADPNCPGAAPQSAAAEITIYKTCSTCPAARSSSQNQTNEAAFEIRVLTTPSASDTTTNLPASVDNLQTHQTYYLELWASDIGNINLGLTSAYVDLAITPGALDVLNINHNGIFTFLTDGTTLTDRIDEIGGSIVAEGIAVQPDWARVATVRFRANRTCGQFTLQPSTTGVACYGGPQLSWQNISLAGLTYYHTYDLNCDGDINLLDFSKMAENWHQTAPNLPGDFDGNNTIDLRDLHLLHLLWLTNP